MKANELRQKFLDFFREKNHAIISSTSLIPENDPTALFISAGMHPLVPNLLGEKHPAGTRLANFQKCIRTGDIEEIGDLYHHTFIEMLGNWSLGDYFKRPAIEYSWEFLTSKKWLNINPDKLGVTVFAGDQDAPLDKEARDIWISLGVPQERIGALGKEDNWWGPVGQTGPCGPDTEIFYWISDQRPPKKFDPKDARWVEIWNNVFMQYNKTKQGAFEPLKQKNVDTGMGFERVLAALNGFQDDYRTELFKPLTQGLENLSEKKYGVDEETDKMMRIIADHVRAAVFILGDDYGVTPSNLDQGYILRRLIRRAVRYCRQLGIEVKTNAAVALARKVVEIYSKTYPELEHNKDRVFNELQKEEDKFESTLEKGLKEFQKLGKDRLIDGKEAFKLFSTYGFPLEMTQELAQEKNIKVDVKGFEKEYQGHQKLSRAGAKQKFKGGLADETEQTARLHTATHLLHAALRQVLGSHVEQRGSNITAQRLRFDFVHDEKLNHEQIKKTQDWVNDKIKKALSIKCEEKTVKQAKEDGAIGIFTQKYGERVKVYTIHDPGAKEIVSMEICGGPHVQNTKELGHFEITKQQAVAAGVRRLKAVLK
ncbi:alanine--tRNA ligase [Patescibacteria group bacterium]|nr:alanine--tRNA ligase [Patescibacteria group bacterium]MBU1922206.1 alanine--tRNA ligase [Patescibacteria group bacterium]